MATERIHVRLTAAQLKNLDKLAEKLMLGDRANTVRYCIARVLIDEGINPKTLHSKDIP